MSFDQPRVYAASVLPPSEVPGDESRMEIEESFRDFILEFRIDSDFIYR